MNKNKTPIFITNDFIIRNLNPETDKISFMRNINNPNIFKNLLKDYPFTEQDWFNLCRRNKDIILNRSKEQIFVIEKNNEVIGEIELHYFRDSARFRSWLAEEYWNMGIMTQAKHILEEYFFKNLKLSKITSDIFAFNKASIRVAEKNGFYLDKVIENCTFKNGKKQNVLLYSKENPYNIN